MLIISKALAENGMVIDPMVSWVKSVVLIKAPRSTITVSSLMMAMILASQSVNADTVIREESPLASAFYRLPQYA